MVREERISLEAVLFAIYVALAPINQILVLGSGSTINKYIGLAVIVVIFLKKLSSGEAFLFNDFKYIVPMFLWYVVTMIWSIDRSGTFSALITLANYIVLWIIVSEKEWNSSEKKLICYLSIAVGIYFTFSLITSQLAGARRSTLVFEGTGEQADQNALGVSLSFLFIIALHKMFETNKLLAKTVMLGACLLFLIGIFSTGSRGALIGLTIGFTYYIGSYSGFYQRASMGKKIIVFISVGTVVYLIIRYNWIINNSTLIRFTDQELLLETGGAGRVELWKMYIEVLNQDKYTYIIGYGYGTTFSAFIKYMWNWAPGTHNTFIYLLVCSGIIGTFLFIRFLLFLLRKSKMNNDLLSKTLIYIVMIAMLTLDLFTRKDIWNVFAFVEIGLGASIVKEHDIMNKENNMKYRYIK